MQRLDKILSEAGVASRKELKSLIRAGRVTVDGAVAVSYTHLEVAFAKQMMERS